MCSYDEPAGVCESANSGIVIFKDCNTTCTGSDGCNDGNDVELLFSAMDESGNPKAGIQINRIFNIDIAQAKYCPKLKF